MLATIHAVQLDKILVHGTSPLDHYGKWDTTRLPRLYGIVMLSLWANNQKGSAIEIYKPWQELLIPDDVPVDILIILSGQLFLNNALYPLLTVY